METGAGLVSAVHLAIRATRAGAKAVRRVIESAPHAGVTTLTLYAFSSDNWERPAAEVASLLRLFRAYLISELASCRKHGVRVNVIGRRDRLPRELVRIVEKTESETRLGQQLHLRLADRLLSQRLTPEGSDQLPRWPSLQSR